MELKNIAFTPMINQYMELKSQCCNIKNCVLFYRLGDFYEMFFEDAKLVSKLLNLTLTKKKIGNNQNAPMCGIPYHASENYINKLISLNYKIAICEQIKNNNIDNNKLMKREITKIVTPGTFSSIENNQKNNFIASIYILKNEISIVFADVNTGQIYITKNTMQLDIEINLIYDEINKFNPSEIIINNFDKNIKNILNNGNILSISKKMHIFNENINNNILDKINILKNNITLNRDQILKLSVEQLLLYCHSLKLDVSKIFNKISLLNNDQFMYLNFSAVKNLELFECLHNKDKSNTLYSILNSNINNAMGTRLLKIILEKPLINLDLIKSRNDFVEEIINNPNLQKKMIKILKNISDIQRLITKIIYKNANAKDLIDLKNSIIYIQKLKQLIFQFKTQYAIKLHNEICDLNDIYLLINNAIVDDPPISINDGYIFIENYNSEIKILRNLAKGGKDKIIEIESAEKQLTGIKNLKILYNKLYGYFIEITNGNLNLVPQERYIRKQTLVNCERYITNELKLHESTVTEASFKLCELEYVLFFQLLENIEKYTKDIQKTAEAISYIDIMNSFAVVSCQNNYVKPIINDSDKIYLKDSRHPVIEKIKSNLFITNDVNLDTNDNNILLITGPNMGGKSTYMRQIALIVIMTQIGCFVPASYANIGVVDKLFTRIGASDNLVNGESTFMLEMKEVVEIINNATPKSLIILDEIGRGTSTYDGISIAQSIVIYIYETIKAKTLFATHYHELTNLSYRNGIKNYHVALKKEKNNIIFLYKIFSGAIKKSYGIEVAQLAGMNNKIIEHARNILNEYEKNNIIK